MMGLIGVAQVLATLAYGLKGLRRGVTTWDWPSFNENPEQENNSQMDRWSLNETPSWSSPPLAIANKYHDHRNNQTKNVRYRLILVRASRPRLATERQAQRLTTKSSSWPQLDSSTTPSL